MSSGTPARNDSFRPIFGVSVVLFLAVLAVAGVRSWRDLEAAHQRERLLETRISGTEAEITRLRNRIERLRSDPGALERLAREDLGMVRPGDVIIELPATVDPISPRPGPLPRVGGEGATNPPHRPPTLRERGNGAGASVAADPPRSRVGATSSPILSPPAVPARAP